MKAGRREGDLSPLKKGEKTGSSSKEGGGEKMKEKHGKKSRRPEKASGVTLLTEGNSDGNAKRNEDRVEENSTEDGTSGGEKTQMAGSRHNPARRNGGGLCPKEAHSGKERKEKENWKMVNGHEMGKFRRGGYLQ